MSNYVEQAQDLEKKAEKKLTGWGFLSNKHEDAADLYDKAANYYKLAKSWDQAGATYQKLASCHLKLDSKHEAANAYTEAGHAYKKTSPKEATSCLQQSVNCFLEIGRLSMAARYCKVNPIFLGGLNTPSWLSPSPLTLFHPSSLPRPMQDFEGGGWHRMVDVVVVGSEMMAVLLSWWGCFGGYRWLWWWLWCRRRLEYGGCGVDSSCLVLEIAEIYEGDQNLEQAIIWYEKAADLFQSEEVSTSANQCRQKIAQYSAQLEQYPKAIEIYEDIARHSLNNNLLKYGAKGHLLNAGICHLCKGDTVSITNALDKYQDMDPTFTGTRENRLLSDLASAIDEQDVEKFTGVLKEFDQMTPLDGWKTTLLLRVKDKLKAQDNDEDDLT
ncbi:hypothetical protein KSS87_013936 [Heliosperma pusillum]|nr:hypothetical protein KSS87_013936 [Heliosperma pusillum]